MIDCETAADDAQKAKGRGGGRGVQRSPPPPSPLASLLVHMPFIMSNDFPAEIYSAAQDKWLGNDHIVVSTLARCCSMDLRGRRILDVGCGNGHLCMEYLNWGAISCVGIDCSETMIYQCENAYSDHIQLQFRHMSSMEMEYNHEFDVAMAIFVLHFNETLNDLKESIKRIGKSLKKNGKLFAFVPNGIADLNPIEEEGRKFGARVVVSKNPRFDGERLPVYFYGNRGNCDVVGQTTISFFFRETYEKVLRECGFDSIEWIDPVISDYGLEKYGAQFFHSYTHPPKDVLLKAVYRG
ncbi:hypothetical protein QR680_017865 [Steinernema hermaphroditum]|uniref:Methyltransferase domain-containing protein n=1 Tax=Steinernema hermaphroditum TaxID=289476 RepID=A0AA39LPF9_9BILA|nr:hypothetical protein QR680_017865 [Steinernema hermaphroditum]